MTDPDKPEAGGPNPVPPSEKKIEAEAEAYDAAADEDRGRTYDAGDEAGSLRPDSSSTAWGLALHVAGLADFGIPILGIGILLPVVIWLLKRDESAFIDDQGRESINFQLNVLMWFFIFGVLSVCCIGVPFLIALPFVEVVMVVMAAVEAAEGKRYRYPLILRFL